MYGNILKDAGPRLQSPNVSLCLYSSTDRAILQLWAAVSTLMAQPIITYADLLILNIPACHMALPSQLENVLKHTLQGFPRDGPF